MSANGLSTDAVHPDGFLFTVSPLDSLFILLVIPVVSELSP